MPILRGRDWGAAGDCLVGGLVDQLGTTGVVVALPRHLIFLPDNNIAGAGTMVMAVPTTFLNVPPVQALSAIAAQPGVELPQFHELLMRIARSTRDAIVMDLQSDVKALRVRSAIFVRGIYYKRPDDIGWRGFSCTKAGAIEVKAIWGPMVRE